MERADADYGDEYIAAHISEILAAAASRHEWTYPAVVQRVIDGDTIVCRIAQSAMLELNAVHVRLEGINAPELGTPDGARAKRIMQTLVPVDSVLLLKHRSLEKFGRFLARAYAPDGTDVGADMLRRLAQGEGT